MPKTIRHMRSNKSKTMGRHHPRATLHGLHKWYEAEFEKLGWMVLADKNGYKDKIVCYKSALMRLKDALETRLKMVKESDRAYDLKLMLKNTNTLIDHVVKDF